MYGPRIEASQADIARVVSRFYAQVRGHPFLGPIFNERISDDTHAWAEHEAKITAFWAKALLYEPGYSGNPMMVHATVPAIQTKHFAIWLGLFDRVLSEELTEQDCEIWSHMAHRIGRGLSLGLESLRDTDGRPPKLT